MKTTLTLLLLFFGNCLYAQSDSAERAVLSHKLLVKEISQEDFSKVGPKWSQFLKKYGEYPELPLDQNGQVRYSYTQSFGIINKEKLFNRTLEWIAVNYGLYSANLYSNPEDGRIILNNNFPVNETYSCNYTVNISIKTGKMLVEFFNIGYQGFFPGHDSGGAWVPDRTVSFSISQVFPVILKNQSEWTRDLDLFKAANTQFKTEIANLWDYLTNYDSYNIF